MAYTHWVSGMPDSYKFPYFPEGALGPNSCGAWGTDYMESKDRWQHFYNLAGLDVPVWAPGAEIDVKFQLTADHGGQAWVMVSCAENITEDGPWTFLERALSDRNHHFLPSSPDIFAWPKDEIAEKHNSVGTSKWKMPADMLCPGGRGVGRWLWKTGAGCNDDMNSNTKKTQPFVLSEFKALNDAFGIPTMPSCSSPDAKYSEAEYFISCFDFSTKSMTETLV